MNFAGIWADASVGKPVHYTFRHVEVYGTQSRTVVTLDYECG